MVSHIERYVIEKFEDGSFRLYCENSNRDICGIPNEKELLFDLQRELKNKLMSHLHPQYFGSELACSICNPNCYKEHGMDKPFFCGNEKCPSNPETLHNNQDNQHKQKVE